MAVTNVGFWRFSGKGRRLEKRGCCQILADSQIFDDPALDAHTRKILQPFVEWAKAVT